MHSHNSLLFVVCDGKAEVPTLSEDEEPLNSDCAIVIVDAIRSSRLISDF